MGFPDPALAPWIALLAAGPPILACAVWDLRRMRIPNGLNALIAGLFPLAALPFLPLEEIGWRLLWGLVVLALGLGLFMLGKMGGGDVKMLAACTPWVTPAHAPLAMQLLALALLAGLGAVLALRFALRGRAHGWRGLRRGARFPMGVSIAAAMLGYLGLRASGVLA